MSVDLITSPLETKAAMVRHSCSQHAFLLSSLPFTHRFIRCIVVPLLFSSIPTPSPFCAQRFSETDEHHHAPQLYSCTAVIGHVCFRWIRPLGQCSHPSACSRFLVFLTQHPELSLCKVPNSIKLKLFPIDCLLLFLFFFNCSCTLTYSKFKQSRGGACRSNVKIHVREVR